MQLNNKFCFHLSGFFKCFEDQEEEFCIFLEEKINSFFRGVAVHVIVPNPSNYDRKSIKYGKLSWEKMKIQSKALHTKAMQRSHQLIMTDVCLIYFETFRAFGNQWLQRRACWEYGKPNGHIIKHFVVPGCI